MESLQRMPSKITNAYMKLQVLVNEIETQIRQFTGLPSDTPGIHILADNIVQKLVVLKNKFTAETVSNDSLPDDLVEIEAKLRDLEAEFYRSNVGSNFVIGDDHEDDVSENGSVCESCLNYDEDEVMVSPEEKVEEAVISPEKDEETTAEDCKKNRKRRRRWWWRTVVILMPASVVWAVCYFDMKQHEGFLVPT